MNPAEVHPVLFIVCLVASLITVASLGFALHTGEIRFVGYAVVSGAVMLFSLDRIQTGILGGGYHG